MGKIKRGGGHAVIQKRGVVRIMAEWVCLLLFTKRTLDV